jgi:hypothetical protein
VARLVGRACNPANRRAVVVRMHLREVATEVAPAMAVLEVARAEVVLVEVVLVEVLAVEVHPAVGRRNPTRVPDATKESPKRSFRPLIVLLVGGDARHGTRFIGDALVRAVASSKFGGNGSVRSLVAAIRGGRVGLVVLLARWIGHSEAGAITAACRAVGVRCVFVDGGFSAAWSLIQLEMTH